MLALSVVLAREGLGVDILQQMKPFPLTPEPGVYTLPLLASLAFSIRYADEVPAVVGFLRRS
eukprot:gene8589-10199_t